MINIESCRGAINNQSLNYFLQSLIFPCGTYVGHLLQKSSQFSVRVQSGGSAPGEHIDGPFR